MATHKITRIEAAELQLQEAIKLFFEKGDPFIIHVLFQNAHEVIKYSVKDVGIVSAYEEAIITVSKKYGEKFVNSIKSFFNFKDNPKKSTDENLKILAKAINNKQKNMLKHSECNQLNEQIELHDYQNVLGIMDAIILLREYKNISEPSWELKDNPLYSGFQLFFIQVGQYCSSVEMQKYDVNLTIDWFTLFLKKELSKNVE